MKRTGKGFERESEGHNSRIERETDMTQFKGTEREKEKGTGRSSRGQREKGRKEKGTGILSRVRRENGRKGQDAFQGYSEKERERDKGSGRAKVEFLLSVYIIGLKWGPKEINPVGLRNFHSC